MGRAGGLSDGWACGYLGGYVCGGWVRGWVKGSMSCVYAYADTYPCIRLHISVCMACVRGARCSIVGFSAQLQHKPSRISSIGATASGDKGHCVSTCCKLCAAPVCICRVPGGVQCVGECAAGCVPPPFAFAGCLGACSVLGSMLQSVCRRGVCHFALVWTLVSARRGWRGVCHFRRWHGRKGFHAERR